MMPRGVKTLMKVTSGFWRWELAESSEDEEQLGFWHWRPLSCWRSFWMLLDVSAAVFEGPEDAPRELPTPQGILDMPALHNIPTNLVDAPVTPDHRVPSFALLPLATVLEGVASLTLAPGLPPDRLALGSWFNLSTSLPNVITGKWYGDADLDPQLLYFLSTPQQSDSYFWMWLPLPPRQPQNQLPYIQYSF